MSNGNDSVDNTYIVLDTSEIYPESAKNLWFTSAKPNASFAQTCVEQERA